MTHYIPPTEFSENVKRDTDSKTTVLESYERLKSINQQDADIEFVNKNRRYSIKDPISMSLIRTPVRGIYCEHIDCFELDTWAIIQENANIYRWRCPLCKKKAYKLKIDALWIQILEEANDNYDEPVEVEFNDQNQYRVITFKESNSGLGKLTATLNNVNGITEEHKWIDPLNYSKKTQEDAEVD